MAEKRMFSKQVLWSDKFIDLPPLAQVLYFQLSMYADDEGFVNCAGYLKRLTGCTDNEIAILCTNGFLIPFESGVYAIAHWKINNNIRADRLKKTSFTDERDMLYVRSDGLYVLDPERAAEQRKAKEVKNVVTTERSLMPANCPSVDRTDKNSSAKTSSDKGSTAEESSLLSDTADKNTLSAAAYRRNLNEKFGTDNVERYIERFNKWADMHGRLNMPMLPTIEKWMYADKVVKTDTGNSSFTGDMLDECLMIDYV